MKKFAAVALMLSSLLISNAAYATDNNVTITKTYYAKASWYKHGKKTANGEKFSPNHQLTVAHRKLPFGTLVRLTNLDNNRSIIARVNDRGPYARGVEFDMTYLCAVNLDMVKIGSKKLKVELIKG